MLSGGQDTYVAYICLWMGFNSTSTFFKVAPIALQYTYSQTYKAKNKRKSVEMEININYYPLKELVKTNHAAETSIVC